MTLRLGQALRREVITVAKSLWRPVPGLARRPPRGFPCGVSAFLWVFQEEH